MAIGLDMNKLSKSRQEDSHSWFDEDTEVLGPPHYIIIRSSPRAQSVHSPSYRQWLLLLSWIDFNTVCIIKYIQYKVWDEVTYPFQNFNGKAVEV